MTLELVKLFAKECGMQLISDMHVVEIAGKRVLLSHGDTFCTLDLGLSKDEENFAAPDYDVYFA